VPFSNATVNSDVTPYPAFDDMFEFVTNGSTSTDREYSTATEEEPISIVEHVQAVEDVEPIDEPEMLPMHEVIED